MPLDYGELEVIFPMFSLFWFILAAIIVIWIIAAVVSECDGWALSALVTFLAATTLFGDFPWAWIAAHPYWILGIIVGYVLAGACWGVFRWFYFAHEELDKYEDARQAWLRGKGIGKLTHEYQPSWLQVASDQFDWIRVKVKGRWKGDGYEYEHPVEILQHQPLAVQNKARITRWMAWWPASVTWFLVDDILIRTFQIIQRWLSDTMDSIAARVFSRVQADFEVYQAEDRIHRIGVKDGKPA